MQCGLEILIKIIYCYICIGIVFFTHLIAMHDDPNPWSNPDFSPSRCLANVRIQIAVIGFFIQSGALYKDHPALILPSSKRPRRLCIVHNCCIYIHLYTKEHGYKFYIIVAFKYRPPMKIVKICSCHKRSVQRKMQFCPKDDLTHFISLSHFSFLQGSPNQINFLLGNPNQLNFLLGNQNQLNFLLGNPLQFNFLLGNRL